MSWSLSLRALLCAPLAILALTSPLAASVSSATADLGSVASLAPRNLSVAAANATRTLGAELLRASGAPDLFEKAFVAGAQLPAVQLTTSRLPSAEIVTVDRPHHGVTPLLSNPPPGQLSRDPETRIGVFGIGVTNGTWSTAPSNPDWQRGYGLSAAELASDIVFEVESDHTYFVSDAEVLVHNCVQANLVAGTKAEIRAQAIAQSQALGESVISSQYKVGAAERGFDFLSFRGTGVDAELIINEVKFYSSPLRAKKFTAFGLGKSGASTLDDAILHADTAIRSFGLDKQTRDVLLSQLSNRTAGVRLIGGPNTNFMSKVIKQVRNRSGYRNVWVGFRVH